MKYYTETISVTLAEKLKREGMPTPKQILCNFIPSYENEKEEYTYGFVFDWLMEEKGIIICFNVDLEEKISDCDWSVYLVYMSENLIPNCSRLQGYHSWHKAAEAAIEKALTLI